MADNGKKVSVRIKKERKSKKKLKIKEQIGYNERNKVKSEEP